MGLSFGHPYKETKWPLINISVPLNAHNCINFIPFCGLILYNGNNYKLGETREKTNNIIKYIAHGKNNTIYVANLYKIMLYVEEIYQILRNTIIMLR